MTRQILHEDSETARNFSKDLSSETEGSIKAEIKRRLIGSWVSESTFVPQSIHLVPGLENSPFLGREPAYLNGFKSASNYFDDLMDRVTYLGPLRSHPVRHHIGTGQDNPTVGSRGELTPEVLISQGQWLIEWCNRWFHRLGIPYQLEIHQSSDDLLGDLIVMGLKKKGSNIVVGPSDVGFGIGQLLPIIVQAGLSVNSDGDITCVEQPEIHLHPRLQAEIADLFIESAIADQYMDVFGENPQWIVETHSEALILRVQRRIREQLIAPSHVSVLYVEPNPTGGSSVTRLRIGEDGEFIDEWPGGFFEETYNETFSGYQE
jgi:hypothetical protein